MKIPDKFVLQFEKQDWDKAQKLRQEAIETRGKVLFPILRDCALGQCIQRHFPEETTLQKDWGCTYDTVRFDDAIYVCPSFKEIVDAFDEHNPFPGERTFHVTRLRKED